MILLQLTANTGPEECCLAVSKALPVLLRDCELSNVSCEVLEEVPGARLGTLRSVLLSLEGSGALNLALRWRGSLQWNCTSPYRREHKRKNWFIGVEVFDSGESLVNQGVLVDKDLRFEATRASGPGGQHVNKTDSAVRATHLPSGISVKVQTERSQFANKRLARALLAHKLANQAKEASLSARAHLWQQHYDVERGNAHRVFKGEAFIEVTRSG